MFGSYDQSQKETASISEAYLKLLEKRHTKPSGKDVEKVAKELEKVADEMKEAFLEGFMDSIKNGVKGPTAFITPEKIADLHRKAAEYKASLSDEELTKIHKALKAGGVKPSPDPAVKAMKEELESALIEAMTDTDFESRAKVAASTKDANLLAAMAQSHMTEDTNGATEICNHVARNPATPKHVLEQLAKHSNPKVVESANNNLTARDNTVVESLTEAFNNGRTTLDDDYVAKQFAAGKPGERKSAKTDGKIYWLHGNEIARQHAEPGKLEFSWANWYTPTTERHLNTILKQVAPGKSVQKKQHKDQGIERFTLDHFKAPDPGKDVITPGSVAGGTK